METAASPAGGVVMAWRNVHVQVYACACAHLCMYVRIPLCSCVYCTCLSVCECIVHMSLHMRACVCLYMGICVGMCMRVCFQVQVVLF